MCLITTPCAHVSKALATGRPYIKLRGTIDEAVTIGGGRVATFLADPGATLTRSSGGAVLTVQDNATSLAVYDLAIADAGDVDAGGIVIPSSGAPVLSLIRVTISNNPGVGISVAGGSLTLVQSVIRNNAGGGVVVTGTTKFAIVGNLFFGNGTGVSATGAAGISTTMATTDRLEFNSFYKNMSQDGVGAAIYCFAGGFTARNNIMFTNGTLTNAEQVGGSCTHVYSIARPGALLPGIGNTAADPLFEAPDRGDLHVRQGSPAIGAADPSSDLTGFAARDPDGAVRVRPATIGAYQMQ